MKIINSGLEARARLLLTPFGVQLCALLAVAIFFRIWHIANIPGINGDEAHQAYKALRLTHGEVFHTQRASVTNSDAFPNIFYLLPLTFLHLFFGPSVVLIRSVAMISGILTLPLNFVMCRRVFDRRSAVISTVVLAILPLNIAYSRFGWEPCQSVAVSALTMYLALLIVRDREHSIRWSILACLSLPIAYDVHGTNIFMAPLVLLALLVRWVPELKRAASTRYAYAIAAALAAVGLAFLAGAHFVLSSDTVRGRLRLHSPAEIAWFFVNYERIFSGATTYRYIPGSFAHVSDMQGVPMPDPRWWDVALLLVGAGILAHLVGHLWRRSTNASLGVDRCLVAGWALALTSFFAIAGVTALLPGSERYGLFLVAPSVLIFTRSVVLFIERRPVAAPGLKIFLAIVAWTSLGSFYFCYFRFFETTGGESELTFRTARTEPRAAAVSYIQKVHRPGTIDYVITSDWWNEWPMRYLAASDKSIVVLPKEEIPDPKNVQGLRNASRNRALWYVYFPADLAGEDRMTALAQAKTPFQNIEMTGYGKQPVLRLLRVGGPASH